jgi:HPt (histidine-containing phosphotransfer) domain-containing protein
MSRESTGGKGELFMIGSALLDSLGNDTQLLREVIGVFLADCPARLKELKAAITARNPEQIIRASHSLRGSASTFGAEAVVEAARQLESMGQQGKLEGVDDAFATLERELALVRKALEEIAKNAL